VQKSFYQEIAMGSRPAAGQWARFVVYGLGDMKEFSNDFWFSISAGSLAPPFNYNACLLAWYNSITTPWAAILTPGTTLRGAYGEFNDGTGTNTTNVYSNVSGTLSGTPMPEDVAAIVRKETANLTKSGKGRWFFSMLNQLLTVGSYLDSTGITNMDALAVGCKTATTYGGATLSPAHFSRKTGLLYPLTDTPVVGLLGTKRRRRGPF